MFPEHQPVDISQYFDFGLLYINLLQMEPIPIQLSYRQVRHGDSRRHILRSPTCINSILRLLGWDANPPSKLTVSFEPRHFTQFRILWGKVWLTQTTRNSIFCKIGQKVVAAGSQEKSSYWEGESESLIQKLIEFAKNCNTAGLSHAIYRIPSMK